MASRSRSLVVPIESTFDDAGVKKATVSYGLFAKELNKLERQQARVDRAHRELGRGLLTGSVAIAAGLGLAAKAAVSWETAWAGVTKTVSGTPAQLSALEEELRGLTKVLPASHEEIAKVAEAAGQLGIQRENIASFTETMIKMGVSTNLSAEDAATGIARLLNISGLAADKADELGSVIVALGNAGASTEQEILEMGLRIEGAANQVGIAAAETLGWANALSSLGIEAEAGGSSISRVFIKISQAVHDGGDELDTFARVAGMSAREFATRWGQDASGAAEAFVQGLGRMQASGGDVLGVLQSLGLTEIRVRDALLRLAGGSDVLTGSLKTAAEEWERNRALQEEADKRFQTTAARLKIAANEVTDFAITIGTYLLPALQTLADVGSDVAGFFEGLPGPVQEAATKLAILTVAVTALSAAALIAAPRIAATKVALETLGVSSTAAAARLGVLGLAIAGVTQSLSFGRDILKVWGDENMGFWEKQGQSALTFLSATTFGMLDLRDKTSDSVDATKAAKQATEQAAVAEEQMTAAIDAATPKLDEQTQALQDLDAALSELYDQLFSVEAAQDAFSASIKAGVKQAKDGKLSTLELREAGRQLVDQAFDVVNAQATQGASAEDLAKSSRRLRDRIYDAMRQMGASKEEARRYADALSDVPEAVSTEFRTPGLDAVRAGAAALGRILAGIPRSITIRAQYLPGGEIAKDGGLVGSLPRFSGGGLFHGAGGPRDDANLVALSNREFIVNARSTAYNLPLLQEINSRRYAIPVGGVAAPAAAAASAGPDVAKLARIVSREVRGQLDGMEVVMDGRTVGQIQGRQADLYGRGN